LLRLATQTYQLSEHADAFYAQSGVDVMITIFGDFSQFSAKKLAFFLNTNVMINFFQNIPSFVLSQKRQFFHKNFWQKYLKNHNIGPRIASFFIGIKYHNWKMNTK
jgi:hypothetical protein